MVLKIYGNLLSQPARAVVIFARAANIEHEFVNLDMMKGEHKKPEYLAVNPSGQVPAISDGDFNLAESHAIMTYLHATRHAEDHWYPADPQKRAIVDRYLHWHHGNLRRAAYVVFAAVYAPLIGRPVIDALLTEATETRGKAFAQLEAWLTASPFLAGAEVSLADISAICEVTGHQFMEFDLTPYPHVQAWAARVLEIPAVAEGHQPLNGFKAMLAAKKQEAAEKAAA